MDIEIREITYGSAEYQLELALRTKVLREPLGLKFKPEDLAREKDDFHLGVFSGGKLLGCLILTRLSENTMKMRQVAVDPSTQGVGIGKKLVQASEEKCRELGISTLELSARDTAVSFYLGLGYEVYGEPFEEVTIPHRRMRKVLPNIAEQKRRLNSF